MEYSNFKATRKFESKFLWFYFNFAKLNKETIGFINRIKLAFVMSNYIRIIHSNEKELNKILNLNISVTWFLCSIVKLIKSVI